MTRWHCKKKRTRSLSFHWTATVAGKQVDRKLMCEGHICQFEMSYRHRFFSLFLHVLLSHIYSCKLCSQFFQLYASEVIGVVLARLEIRRRTRYFCYFSLVCYSLAFWFKRFYVRMWMWKGNFICKKTRPFGAFIVLKSVVCHRHPLSPYWYK